MVLLEEAPATAARAEDFSPQRPAYCWPVWRFGRVLSPVGERGLTVEESKSVGSLFEEEQPSANRYLEDRIPALARLASDRRGRRFETWQEVPFDSRAITRLQRRWKPKEILITYSFVPIIRLPDLLIGLGDGIWHVRESITVCGSPAKSKIWLTASLLLWRGRPTDREALSLRELGAARSPIEEFSREALDSMTAFYLEVLNTDSRHLKLETPLRFDQLATFAQAEICGLASLAGLESAFETLEEKGLTYIRRAADEGGGNELQDLQGFLDWAREDPVEPSSSGGEWEAGRPKVLAIYADNTSCGSVRAVCVPRLSSQGNRTRYLALTEVLEKPDWPYPLSESACRYLAREYGRYF